jgi:hypothetical protein
MSVETPTAEQVKKAVGVALAFALCDQVAAQCQVGRAQLERFGNLEAALVLTGLSNQVLDYAKGLQRRTTPAPAPRIAAVKGRG